MTYRISKFDPVSDKWICYGGGYTEKEVKQITKGFRFNGLFYERKGSKVIFEVVAE